LLAHRVVCAVLQSCHEVENELLTPLNHALYHIQRQHTKTVENVDAFVKNWPDFIVVFLNFTQSLGHLLDCCKTRLPANNGPDSWLDGCLFILEVFYFFDYNVTVLLGCESEDAVKKDCPVVVRDQVIVPCLQKLFFQMVDYVCRYQILWQSGPGGWRKVLLRCHHWSYWQCGLFRRWSFG